MSVLVKNKKSAIAVLAAALGSLSLASVHAASADTLNTNIDSGSFDLTKKAGSPMTYPVAFDRPSGVNGAALAGALQQLGSSSQLFKSAAAQVPDLNDSSKMSTLLSDALNKNSANYTQARQDIVGLINWYNSLGGTQIKTQAGEAYTVDNLDDTINVLGVGFSNNKSINSKAMDTLNALNNAKTVGDVQKALDAVKSGTSSGYQAAFDAYNSKLKAPGADIKTLSQYSSMVGVLSAYEKMYSDGASAVRQTLLDNQSGSTEAGVAFFESAVIVGSNNTFGGDSSNNGSQTNNNQTPSQVTYTTKYVDDKGNPLAPNVTGTNYGDQKTINGYDFKTTTTDDSSHTKTYVYTQKTTPTETVYHTKYVDESGNPVSGQVDGKSYADQKTIDGYTFKTVTTDDGSHTKTYVYTKNATPQPTKQVHTYYFDTDGNILKDRVDGALPAKDRDTIGDFVFKQTTTVTAADVATGGRFANTGFAEGDVINIYAKKTVTPTPTVVHTKWVDESRKSLKDQAEGSFPDDKGDAIPGYKIVSVVKDNAGNVTNTYKKIADVSKDTVWVDESGKELKAKADGSFPDTKGDAIPGYTLVSSTTKTDANGNIHVVNTYKQTPVAKVVHTTWVDESGKSLKDQAEGSFPDTKGNAIPGYTLVRTDTDSDGNVKNVYKAEIKQVTTSYVDESGKTLSADVTGDKFGDQKSIDGYTYKEVKLSDDGTHKTYVYTKNATPVTTPSTTTTTPVTTTPSTATTTPVSTSTPSVASTLPNTGTDTTASRALAAAGSTLVAGTGLRALLKRRKDMQAKAK